MNKNMNKTNQSVVERLQKSRQASDEAFFAEGKQDGRKWAENHAETISDSIRSYVVSQMSSAIERGAK